MIRTLFPPKVAWNILKQLVRPIDKPDQLYWSLKPMGIYTVSSSYQWLMNKGKCLPDPRAPKMWKTLWSLQIPPRWKILIWKGYHDALPTGSNWKVRKMEHSYVSPMCNNKEETTEHIFKDYWLSKRIWWISLLIIKIDANPMFLGNVGRLTGCSI